MEIFRAQYWAHHIFSIYALPVGHIMRKYYRNAKFMFVAYDQQLYVIFDLCDPLHVFSSMEPLIADVRVWLIKNFLLVNDTKTDALIASSRHHPPINFPPVQVANDLIVPSATIENVGVIFTINVTMTMEKQIRTVVRQAFLSLSDM